MAFFLRKSYWVVVVGLLVLGAAFMPAPSAQPVQTIRTAYVADLIALDSATAALQRAVENRMPAKVMQKRFRRARLAYKRIEWLTEAFYPFSARQLNVFGAMRLEVFRLISLGVSGFDSPIARQSLPEAAESLKAIRRALTAYPITQTNWRLANRLNALLFEAIQMLNHQSFNRLDRIVFIRDLANSLSKTLFDAQTALHIPVVTQKRLLAPSAQTLNDSGIFNPQFFAPPGAAPSTPARIALGRLLFSSPLLALNANPLTSRSCASCHQPERAFTDGQPTALALGSEHDRIKRNTPTLLNAGLQTVQFLDARSLTIEDQIDDVLTNPREMGGSWVRAVQAIKADTILAAAFRLAYGKQDVSRQTISNALAHYVRSLVRFNTRFDRYMRGLLRLGLRSRNDLGLPYLWEKLNVAPAIFILYSTELFHPTTDVPKAK